MPQSATPPTPGATVIAPPGTPRETWLALRNEGLGGTDILTILNMNPKKGKLQLYYEKTGQYTQPRDPALERSARRGNRLESLVAEFLAEETGHTVLPAPGTLARTDEPWMRVNIDGTVLDPNPAVAEYKTRTWRSAQTEGWNGDDPPDGPTVQACWGMKITGWQRAYVGALIDDDFKYFVIERDDELLAHLETAARRFWFDHVLARNPPPPDALPETARMLSRLWDVRPELVKTADALHIRPQLERRRALKQHVEKLEEDIRGIEAELKVLAGEAELVRDITGRDLYSFARTGNFAHARFRAELPEIAAQYTAKANAPDLARIKTERPDLYNRFRARRFNDRSTT